ncbi:hypothetical protein V2J09_008986 [Rumex salicifolius]
MEGIPKIAQENQLEPVHGDSCGPITPRGNKYFLLLVDDYLRFMWITLLNERSEAFEAFKKFKSLVENEVEGKAKYFRTDRGGEFTSLEFRKFCDDEGVKRHLIAPYSPQRNEVVKRRNQTVMEMTRSIMKSRGVPAKYWGEVMKTSVYILNKDPTKSVEKVTPYQSWHGKALHVQHLRVFGCLAHVKTVSPNLTKLAFRSTKVVLLGCEEGSKAYRLLDPSKWKVIESKDVLFEEEKGCSWQNDQGTYKPDCVGTFTITVGRSRRTQFISIVKFTRKLIKCFRSKMMQRFEMSDLGFLSYYLGIEVQQDRDEITLCQSNYARKILEKVGMVDCNIYPLPMEPSCKLNKHDGEPPMDAIVNKSIIGSLRYLVNTRPDLAYSVGVVNRYMETPTTSHMAAIK